MFKSYLNKDLSPICLVVCLLNIQWRLPLHLHIAFSVGHHSDSYLDQLVLARNVNSCGY